MKNKLLLFIIVLSVFAMLLTSYLTFLHYMPSTGSICSINSNVNCDKVNKSPYSNFFYAIGFPDMQYFIGFDISVAVLGFLTYFVLFLLAGFLFSNKDFLPIYVKKKHLTAIFLLSLSGFLFSSYLTYIEAFILNAWCIFCVAQAIVITLILLTAIILLRSKQF